jgi:uncharacterized membrane protein
MGFFKRLIFVLVLILAAFTPKTAFAQEFNKQEEILEGKIVEIVEQNQLLNTDGNQYITQKLKVLISKGSIKGEFIEVTNSQVPVANAPVFKKGDKVLLAKTAEQNGDSYFYITDYIRRTGLFILFSIFVICVVAVGGVWGLTSLLGMAISFLVIFFVILPQILKGADPVSSALIGAALIIPATFYLSHGFNSKTHIAIASTLATLIFTGFLAGVFVDITGLTGLASEEAGFLQSMVNSKVNLKGLLLAGIIIASLGVLDDITISQASVVKELKEANKKLSFKELFLRAMKVGRDHISSLVNTLVLVYAGASFPLLLLFLNNPLPFSQIINMEIIAEEIVRTLVGSIGLIFTVPITTALAAFFMAETINEGRS